ncbi:MAG TPA: hypothetical protein VJ792_02770 [Candidatus Nitrosotalea sp.]|nr:hypothetical protein [Candidatus Nitrosotalea sp.]
MKFSLVLVLGLLFSVGIVPFAHASSDISISPPTTVDTTGHPITSYGVGQEIGIQSVLANHGTTNQKFSYLVQVNDPNGVTDYFAATSASMLGNQSFTATQVWIPKETGTYTIQVFVWDSLASAIPLTDVLQKQVTVS